MEQDMIQIYELRKIVAEVCDFDHMKQICTTYVTKKWLVSYYELRKIKT